jgi:IclR family transcriptional regulator, mhp operon transcriptional activator
MRDNSKRDHLKRPLVGECAMEKGVPIRAISRGLAVLQAVNRHGSLTMMEIAQASGVPYPTACRIVQTLLHEGMIEKEPSRKRYRATLLVRTLSVGFQDEDRLAAIARPHIAALTKRVAWPTSIASRVGNMMMVRESTHHQTSLTFSHYYPGFTLPLLECASGKAYMAFASEEERANILQGLKSLDAAPDKYAALLLETGTLLDEVRRNGYATQARNRYSATPGKTSSIAVPVFEDGKVCGALSLIFFASALTMEQAVARFVGDMKATSEAISAEMGGDARAPAAAA